MHDCRFCWRNAVRNEIKHHPRYSSDSKLQFSRQCQMRRSEEHTSELQSLMRISYAVFCLKKKNKPELIAITYVYQNEQFNVYTDRNNLHLRQLHLKHDL